jgi:methylated-DNA-[protein]-cysteine S-methyltransferase
VPTTVFALDHLPTPIGHMLVVVDELQRLRALDWEDYEARMHRLLSAQYKRAGIQVELTRGRAPPAVREALQQYLHGKLTAIDAIVVETAGTEFQRQVWTALRAVPAGTTLSYGALAARIGRPSAVRAVGHANGSNPVGVVVPCHRVIGTNASLTGYGGGLHRKRWLLEHEGVSLS